MIQPFLSTVPFQGPAPDLLLWPFHSEDPRDPPTPQIKASTRTLPNGQTGEALDVCLLCL